MKVKWNVENYMNNDLLLKEKLNGMDKQLISIIRKELIENLFYKVQAAIGFAQQDQNLKLTLEQLNNIQGTLNKITELFSENSKIRDEKSLTFLIYNIEDKTFDEYTPYSLENLSDWFNSETNFIPEELYNAIDESLIERIVYDINNDYNSNISEDEFNNVIYPLDKNIKPLKLNDDNYLICGDNRQLFNIFTYKDVKDFMKNEQKLKEVENQILKMSQETLSLKR